MKKELLKIMMVLPSLLFWQGVSGQYCQGGPASTFDSNIESLSLTGDNGTTLFYTGCPGVTGVEDESAQVVELTAGDTYTLDITIGTCSASTYGGVAEVWIDYNQNDIFDASESIGTATIPGFGSGPVTETLVFTVPITATGGVTGIRAMHQESGALPLNPCGTFSWGSVVDFSADITPAAATCPFPTGLTATATSQEDVDLTWTPGDAETIWNVEWGAPGFAPGTGNEIGSEVVSPTPSYSVTGLTPETNYEFYVQADCGGGDESFWTGPVSVFTGYCSPTYTSTSDYPTLFETEGAVENVVYQASSHPGLPGYLNLSGSDTIKVEENEDFDFESIFSPASHTILIWVDWNNDLIFDASEQVFAGQNPGSIIGNIVIPPGTAIGTYRMRVRTRWGTSPINLNMDACETTNWGLAIDYSLDVLPEPTCPRPIDLIVSNIFPTSATAAWTAGGSETEWEVEYDTVGFVLGTGNTIVTSDNPYSLVGLDPNTEYDIYVRGVCEPGDTSTWRGPVSFTTPCEIFSAPYEEDFNGPEWVSGTGFNNIGAEISGCWTATPEITALGSQPFAWGTRTGTTGSNFSTGPNSAANGLGNYIFTESSNGLSGDIATFDSPLIDLSTINDPYLTFSYHMYGSDIDSLNVLISNDGGTTFDSLLTIVGQQQFDNSDPWIDTSINLLNYINDTIVIRFFNVKISFNDDIAIDEFSILSCIPNGGEDNEIDVCRLDESIDLNDQITINQGGGKWDFPANQSLITNESIFNVSTLPTGIFNVFYIVPGACEDDTTILTLNIFPPSSAGIKGTIEVCRNQPINLFDGLNGNVDMGGQWYDSSGNPIAGSQPVSSNIPGSFNYDYIVSNGVCPADTQFVEVIVGTCDHLSVGSEEMQEINVFPNPATEVLNILNGSNLEGLRIEMYDATGRLVLTDNKALANAMEATISIAHLETGAYTMRVRNNDGERVFKIIKQ